MIFRSPFGEVTVPETTLPAFVREHAGPRGDRPALIDGPTGRTLTYGDLVCHVSGLSAGLAERAIGADAVVALCAPNMPEYAVVFRAVAAVGGVVTTGNPAYTAEEMGFAARRGRAPGDRRRAVCPARPSGRRDGRPRGRRRVLRRAARPPSRRRRGPTARVPTT